MNFEGICFYYQKALLLARCNDIELSNKQQALSRKCRCKNKMQICRIYEGNKNNT